MYRGNGDRRLGDRHRRRRSARGWGPFTALLAPGDFSGDGLPDVLARQADGTLLMYRGDGDGGWVTGKAETIGTGWQTFSAIMPGGDFSGDGKPRRARRQPGGALLLYRGNGAGGWVTGAGRAGRQRLGGVHRARLRRRLQRRRQARRARPHPRRRAPALPRQRRRRLDHRPGRADRLGLERPRAPDARAHDTRRAPAPPAPEPVPPPAAPVPDGNVSLTAGIRCTPPGGLLRVSLKVRKRSGRPAPQGAADRLLRPQRPAPDGPQAAVHRAPADAPPGGPEGPRVRARLLQAAGSKKLRAKTVSRRYVMCS